MKVYIRTAVNLVISGMHLGQGRMLNSVSSSHQNDRSISCTAEESRAILTTNTPKLAMLHVTETTATERTTGDIHPAHRAPAGHSWATQ